MHFNDRLQFKKQSNILKNFNKQINSWSKTCYKVCKDANKDIGDSVFFRAKDHRIKKELKNMV